MRFNKISVVMALALTVSVAQAADETIVVVGNKENNATGSDYSYPGVSRTATKTSLPVSETPRAVSVVTREQMDDRASVSISDALQYTPGIQTNYFGEDNKQDWFVIRGFQQAGTGLYQDGTRLYSVGFYSWQIDPFGLERVEILRGPVSALYGQTPPGGLINVVSRRPQFDGGSGQVAVEYGSFDRKQADLDVNKEINDDLVFRLLALGRKNGTRVDKVNAERLFLAPSLTWKMSDDTKLTILTSYQKDDSNPYLQFLPMEGTLTDNPNGRISDKTAIGNPDWEKFGREQLSLGYEFEHAFNSDLSFFQAARYSHMDIDLRQIYALNYSADTPGLGALLDPTKKRQTILRGASTEKGHSDAFNIDNRILYSFSTGVVNHTLLAGLDYQQININSKDFAADPLVADGNNILNTPLGRLPDPNFNVYHPGYTNNIMLVNSSTFQPLTDADREIRNIRNRQLGLYLQDQLHIASRWVVQAGARYDDVNNKQNNISTKNKWAANYNQWTTILGAAYLSDIGLVPYVNYAQSFEPILDTRLTEPKPERGESYEAGLKYQLASFDGYFNVAAYQATKKNLLQVTGKKVSQVGEVRNRGIEFEAVANVTPSLTLVSNLSFIDSKITEDTDMLKIGKRPAHLAAKLASAWAQYRFIGGDLDGLAIGGGVRYIGSTYGDNYQQNKVPSYTLYDAAISYRVHNYKFQVATKNIFDKKYVATCNYYCWYGDRRNIIASISYDW